MIADQMKKIVDTFLKETGLNVEGLKYQVDREMVAPFSERLNFTLQMPIDLHRDQTNRPEVKFFRDLMDQMMKSPMVQVLTDRHERKIKEMEVLIHARDLELEELRQYKTHFDLEMKLRHGEKDDE
jgi:nucleoside diphosphate kinase